MSDLALTFFQVLQEAGVKPERATAAAESLNKAIADQYNIHSRELATKADLAEAKAEIIKWNMGAILAAVGLAVAIIKLIG